MLRNLVVKLRYFAALLFILERLATHQQRHKAGTKAVVVAVVSDSLEALTRYKELA